MKSNSCTNALRTEMSRNVSQTKWYVVFSCQNAETEAEKWIQSATDLAERRVKAMI
jgi:hypothetical protein